MKSSSLWIVLPLCGLLFAPPFVSAQSPTETHPTEESSSHEWGNWHVSAYVDLAYIVDFNFPENHLWRSRTTSNRFNEFAPNMGYLNVRKDTTADSRWGMELGVQGGYDSKDFAFLQGEPKVGGPIPCATCNEPMSPTWLPSETV